MGKADTARLGDFMERTIWNALFAAQSPDGRRIRYYTPLLGNRAYFNRDVFCCPNNYRRLIARLSDFAVYTHADAIFANLYTPLETTLEVGGVRVGLRETTDYPSRETIAFGIDPERPAEFSFSLRIPKWCATPSVTVNGQEPSERPVAGSVYALRRRWQKGDRVELNLPMTIRPVLGRMRQAGRIALLRGPLVYAFNPKTANKDQHPFDFQRTHQVDPKTCRLVDDATVRPDGTGVEMLATGSFSAIDIDPQKDEWIRLTEFADPDAAVTYFRTPQIQKDGVPDELFR